MISNIMSAGKSYKLSSISPFKSLSIAFAAAASLLTTGCVHNPQLLSGVHPEYATPILETDGQGHVALDANGKPIKLADCMKALAGTTCQFPNPGAIAVTTGTLPTISHSVAEVLGGAGSAAAGATGLLEVHAVNVAANAQATYSSAAAQGKLQTTITTNNNAQNGGTIATGGSKATGGNVTATNSTVATNGSRTSSTVTATGSSVVSTNGATGTGAITASGQSVIGSGTAGSITASGQSVVGNGSTAGSITTTNTASGQSVIGSGTAGSNASGQSTVGNGTAGSITSNSGNTSTKTNTTTTDSNNNCSTTVSATGGKGNASGTPNVSGGCGGSSTQGGAYGNQTVQSAAGQSSVQASSPDAANTAGSITGTTTTNSTTQSGSAAGGTTTQKAPAAGTTVVPATDTTLKLNGDTGASLQMPVLPFGMQPKAYASLSNNGAVVVMNRDGSADLYTALETNSSGRPAGVIRKMTFNPKYAAAA